ncbi:hypothetical protein ABIE53_001086 [Burkholderia sp. OAS925]
MNVMTAASMAEDGIKEDAIKHHGMARDETTNVEAKQPCRYEVSHGPSNIVRWLVKSGLTWGGFGELPGVGFWPP